MSEMIERVARAIEAVDISYHMQLVNLVDGVYTYEIVYANGDRFEFESTDDVYAHVAERRSRQQARAAIEAMREPTQNMIEVANISDRMLRSDVKWAWQASIDQALR